MLVLTRGIGEWIHIGDDIRVVVLDKRSDGKIRIGVEAPKEVLILREELVARGEDRPEAA